MNPTSGSYQTHPSSGVTLHTDELERDRVIAADGYEVVVTSVHAPHGTWLTGAFPVQQGYLVMICQPYFETHSATEEAAAEQREHLVRALTDAGVGAVRARRRLAARQRAEQREATIQPEHYGHVHRESGDAHHGQAHNHGLVLARTRAPRARHPLSGTGHGRTLLPRGADEEKVQGLQLGADDYLTKPFSVEDLLARVQTVLRRTRFPLSTHALRATTTIVELTIDFTQHLVTMCGNEIALTPTEYRLLAYLTQSAGHVVTKERLLGEIWGSGRRKRPASDADRRQQATPQDRNVSNASALHPH